MKWVTTSWTYSRRKNLIKISQFVPFLDETTERDGFLMDKTLKPLSTSPTRPSQPDTTSGQPKPTFGQQKTTFGLPKTTSGLPSSTGSQPAPTVSAGG